MDFERVLRTLLEAFAQQHIRYGAIGGFAMGALGVPRATADVDFLVHREDLPRLDHALTNLGYLRYAQTENVSHYRHPEKTWGALDFLHAFRKFALAMLDRTRECSIFNGTQTLRVVQPEDLIGLKVQAIANDPLRKSQEQADIEVLVMAYGKTLDWHRIQEYYELFELGAEARRLRKQFGHAE